MRRLVSLLGTWALLWVAGCATPGAARRDPEQSRIRYELGADYYSKQRIEPALEELSRALELDPDNADAYNLMGIIALQQGADYLTQLEIVDCLHGSDAEAVRADAVERFRQAEGYLRKAVALRPGFSEAWNNLAVAALQLQDYPQAIAAAQAALKDITYGQPSVARANLGWAYFHQGDLQKAWKELHEAVIRSPNFCVGRYRLAKVYVERKQYDAALEELATVAAQKECPIQEVHLLGGLVQQRLRQTEEARRMFSQCISLAPRSCLAAQCQRYGEMLQ